VHFSIGVVLPTEVGKDKTEMIQSPPALDSEHTYSKREWDRGFQALCELSNMMEFLDDSENLYIQVGIASQQR
jgi:hypothetical protein